MAVVYMREGAIIPVWNKPVAVRKEIFRWQLVANREVSGRLKVGRVPVRRGIC